MRCHKAFTIKVTIATGINWRYSVRMRKQTKLIRCFSTCSLIVPHTCCLSFCLLLRKYIYSMCWAQYVPRFLRRWWWNAHLWISLVWLASAVLNTPLHFTQFFVHWRSWPTLTVVGHGVCGGQKRQLWLCLWSLYSGRALSQALALLGSRGDRRANYKNLFLCRRAAEQGSRDGMGELWWEFSSGTLKMWRGGGRKEKERRGFWLWSSAQRLWLGGEIWSGALRIMLVC